MSGLLNGDGGMEGWWDRWIKTIYQSIHLAIVVVVLTIALFLPVSSHAVTLTATSCSQSAVQAAINAAQAGDTVAIPAGTCAWSNPISWTAPANVTLMGAGTSATGGGDQTVIVDNYATNRPLLSISVPATGTFRMTGITVKGGSGALKDGGLINLDGPGAVRLDHLHLNSQTYSPANNLKILWVGSGVTGVL